MKRLGDFMLNFKRILKMLLITLVFFSFYGILHLQAKGDDPVFKPLEHHTTVSQIVNHLIAKNHYQSKDLNDELSGKIYENYLKSLDNNRMYLLKSDVKSFEKHRLMMDDYLKKGELEPAFEMFNVYYKRITQRLDYALSIMKNPFNYKRDEDYMFDREKAPYFETEDELNNYWRQRVKYDILSLKLSGRSDSSAVATIETRYKNWRNQVSKLNNEDVFQMFVNSFTETIDPHTNYFSPRNAEDFNINMSLSLEGIGASLNMENEYVRVVELIPGGPAITSNQIFKNDRIIAVGQGEKGEMVEVIGWRLDDVITLIRGKKGTTVRLTLLAPDETMISKSRTISLVRDKINLNNQAAKADVIDIEHDGQAMKIGVIDLPSFYSDFEAKGRGDKNYRSTTRDVRLLLDNLKSQGIQGLILDLRNNGGGSLDEAIDLSGLFIKSGPIVQIRNYANSIQIANDDNQDIIWEGPLTILVNRYSASASEIFAAAMQDYGRGIVVGETTFGKGTVQNVAPLDRFFANKNKGYGQMKFTTAKFYRINGSSTQRKGVFPDILMPLTTDTLIVGENNQENALEWDQIKSADYKIFGDLTSYIKKLDKNHEQRVNDDKDLQYLKTMMDYNREVRSRQSVPLHEEKLKAQRDEDEKNRNRTDITPLAVNENFLTGDGISVKPTERKDPILREAVLVTADFVKLQKAQNVAKNPKTDKP